MGRTVETPADPRWISFRGQVSRRRR